MSKYESIFTNEETKFIIDNYCEMTSNEIAKELGFTVEQIRSRINFLGIRKKKHIFTKEETEYIKNNYPNKTIEELAIELNKATEQIKNKIYNLGLYKGIIKYLTIDNKETKMIDVTGQKFNRLTIVSFHKRHKNNKYYWKCKCDCPSNKPVYATLYDLKSGRITSCGCLRKELLSVRNSKTFTKSFKDWCIENKKEKYLELWDYELNNKEPNEVAFQSELKYYFKCPQNKHDSELYVIKNIIRHSNYDVMCAKCNSFAQWGIDNICEDFLKKYWDYNKNIVNPWEIVKGCKKKVWLFCQNKFYHESYYMDCDSFYHGSRCPYCSSQKIHTLDSLGKLYPKSLSVWSNKNKISPYKLAPKSHKEYWYKCENGIHKDYKRVNHSAIRCDFKCPECGISFGEQRVANYLINNKITYFPQKIFDDLIGINGGNLRFDFYLELNNLKYSIEYDGQGHYKPIDFDGKGKENAIKEFEKLKAHDKLKDNYCLKNNIKMIRIPYWDFDNIEEILSKELNAI